MDRPFTKRQLAKFDALTANLRQLATMGLVPYQPVIDGLHYLGVGEDLDKIVYRATRRGSTSVVLQVQARAPSLIRPSGSGWRLVCDDEQPRDREVEFIQVSAWPENVAPEETIPDKIADRARELGITSGRRTLAGFMARQGRIPSHWRQTRSILFPATAWERQAYELGEKRLVRCMPCAVWRRLPKRNWKYGWAAEFLTWVPNFHTWTCESHSFLRPFASLGSY